MTPSVSFPPAVVDKNQLITCEPIDLAGLLARAHHPHAGAVVLFSGDVRNHSNARGVKYLEYEAHIPMASNMIKKILEEASTKWALTIAVAQHRIGQVLVCESAVAVITASPHRKEAYAANRYIIDKIKHEAPIWKCEYFSDGSKQWGGNCNCQAVTGVTGRHIYDE